MGSVTGLLVVMIFVHVQHSCDAQFFRSSQICSSTVTMVNRCHGPLSDVIFKKGQTTRCSSTEISPGKYALSYACDTTRIPVFALKNGCQKVQISDFHASQVHSMTCLEPMGDGCINGGTCRQASNHTYSCECPPGFSGQHCEINIDDCASNPCQNNGSCVDGVNSFSCACVTGYTGDTCDTNANDCTSSSCHNNGTCVDGIDSYVCTCPAGFDGPHCELNIDDCVSSSCQNNGRCVDGVNGFSCICLPGYTGDNCDTNDDPCTSVTCQNGGNCVISGGAASCNCSQDFGGPLCEKDCWESTFDMILSEKEAYSCMLSEISRGNSPLSVAMCRVVCIEHGTCEIILFDENTCKFYTACDVPLTPNWTSTVMHTYKCGP